MLLLPYTLLHHITAYYARPYWASRVHIITTLYLVHRITLYAGAAATLKMITKETKMKENNC